MSTIPGDGDGRQPLRQQTYIRALETVPGLTVHHGHYLSHTTRMPLAQPSAVTGKFAEVIRTEEKGSDVNLATMLLLDAFKKDFEQAVVITNDSDLALPIELTRAELKLPVGVVFPCTRPGRQPSARLRKVATFTRDIREANDRPGGHPCQGFDPRRLGSREQLQLPQRGPGIPRGSRTWAAHERALGRVGLWEATAGQ